MRAALWLVGLFGAAVAVALFVGNHQGTVTVFWPPWRVDLSLNLVVVGLLGGFVLLHAALRATSALLALPRQARRWRQQQKERAMHEALLQALSYLLAGRFLRARKAALSALTQAQSLADSGVQIPHNQQLRAFAHLVAADCSHALQDSHDRETHWQQALAELPAGSSPQAQGLREGLVIRAARWSLDERDSQGALQHLHTLPHGAARRTAALRIKLKASRLVGHTQTAMETARLLGKHRAFSAAAAQTLVRGLALELISQANDASALQQVWQSLDATERAMPELALHAVVNALDFQHVQRAPDVGRWPFLACVRHEVKAQLTAARKDACKFFRGVADFAAVQADADEFVLQRQRLLQRLKGIFFAQMAQKTQNQAR